MTDIKVVFVSGGSPDVILNGKYFKLGDDCLSLKKEMVRITKETPGFQFIKSVTAWEGAIAPHIKDRPAQNLREAVSFKSITLDEGDKNTRDHDFIDKAYPILALLAWCDNPHFNKRGISNNFECLVCGKTHFMPHTPRYPSNPPASCESLECYSHTIRKMLDAE